MRNSTRSCRHGRAESPQNPWEFPQVSWEPPQTSLLQGPDGNLTVHQKNVCEKSILVTGVNAAGQEETIPINYKVVTRDQNSFIDDPNTPPAEREAARKRRANWGITDEEAYFGTPYIKDPGATITDASNCGGSVTEKVVNQLTAQLGIPISVGKGQADATPISKSRKRLEQWSTSRTSIP